MLAGVAEGFSILALLPLLGIVISGEQSKNGLIYWIINSALGFVGLPINMISLLGVMVVASIVKALMVLSTGKQVGYAAAQVATDLRLGIIRGMLEARWTHFISQPIGRLSNAISGETSVASSAFLSAGQLVASLVRLLAYLLMAVLVSPVITLLALGIGILIMTLLRGTITHTRNAGHAMAKTLRSLSVRFADGLQGIKPLKAMGRESALLGLLEQENAVLQRTQEKRVFNKWLLQAMPEPILIVFLAIGAYVSLQYLRLDVEALMVAAFLFVRSVGAINNIQSNYQSVVATESAFLLLLGTIREAKEQHEVLAGGEAPHLQREIVLDRVNFAFGDRQILHDVSMTVPAKAITALIGPSGAGKTTVVDLIVGLFRPQSGNISCDGARLERLDQRAWRNCIGYVPQDLFLFHGDLATNVSLGDPSCTERDVVAALQAAEAWDFVSKLPEGIHTVVGERGLRLSGGQRQRVAIARALVMQPKLLVLDEATTALDPVTEAGICSTLQRLSQNMTVLAISHQQAITRIADKVYRIEDGRVVEQQQFERSHAPSN